MTITCPECGFSATVDPTRAPVAGTMAGCPKCSCRFPVGLAKESPEVCVEQLLVRCPACSHEQPIKAACGKCGVIFARYRPPALRRPETPQPPPVTPDYRLWFRRAVWPIAVVLGLLLLWIGVKDLIPTTVTTVHETLGVTSGVKHSVAVRSDGTVWSWGDNGHGQLGNGLRDAGHGAPRKVQGLDDVVAVAAGERHTLALKKDGTVWSWGDNEQGQLGDATGITGRAEPAQIAGLEGVSAIGAGDFFSVVLRRDGTLWQFGNGMVGGVTDGAVGTDIARPRQIAGIGGVSSFACGRKSVIALKENGSVWCWGLNVAGQCGDGGNGIQWAPKEVAGVDGAVAVAAGEDFALALKGDGTVWGWGSLYLASGKSLQRQSKPAPIPELTGIREIRAGYWLALALRRNGTVWHSGVDGKGVPGEQRSFADLLKRQKTAATGAIFAGGKDAFLERNDGTLICWGLNDYGKPAQKGEKKSLSMAELAFDLVVDLDAVAALAEDKADQTALRFHGIAAGATHSLGLGRDGTVWAWGENEAGQVADRGGGSINAPRQVLDSGGRPLEGVSAIATGANTSLAVKGDGSLWFWGQNQSLEPHVNYSRSGSNGEWSGGPNNNVAPRRVEGAQDAVAVSGGYGGRFVVLHGDGRLSAFGTFDRETPPMKLRPFPGVTEVAAVAAGTKHVAVLKKDGTVWTWGNNDDGQLGNGSTTPQDSFQKVRGLAGVISLTSGNNVTLAVKKDGTVWGWGKNVYGATAKGLEVTSALSPTQIPGLKEMVAVAVPGNGYRDANHFLAADRLGRVYTWGFNSHGQLGQGTKGHVTSRKPAVIENLDGVTAIAAGINHCLALCTDGTLRSWGGNSSGQLGNGSGSDSALPVRVVGPKKTTEKKP